MGGATSKTAQTNAANQAAANQAAAAKQNSSLQAAENSQINAGIGNSVGSDAHGNPIILGPSGKPITIAQQNSESKTSQLSQIKSHINNPSVNPNAILADKPSTINNNSALLKPIQGIAPQPNKSKSYSVNLSEGLGLSDRGASKNTPSIISTPLGGKPSGKSLQKPASPISVPINLVPSTGKGNGTLSKPLDVTGGAVKTAKPSRNVKNVEVVPPPYIPPVGRTDAITPPSLPPLLSDTTINARGGTKTSPPVKTTLQIGDVGYQGVGSAGKGNSGNAFGNGKITFNREGDTLLNGKIIQFGNEQNQENFFAARGVNDKGEVGKSQMDQAKFNWSDWSPLANFNLQGNKELPPYQGKDFLANFYQQADQRALALGAKERNPNSPTPFSSQVLKDVGNSGNAGQNKLAPNSLQSDSVAELAAEASEALRATKSYDATKYENESNGNDYIHGISGGSGPAYKFPVGFRFSNMGQAINGPETPRGSAAELALETSEALRATKSYDATKYENETNGNDYLKGLNASDLPPPLPKDLQGKNFGYAGDDARLGTVQLVRGSEAESDAINSSLIKAMKSYDATKYENETNGNDYSRGINAYDIGSKISLGKSTRVFGPPTDIGGVLGYGYDWANLKTGKAQISSNSDISQFLADEAVKASRDYDYTKYNNESLGNDYSRGINASNIPPPLPKNLQGKNFGYAGISQITGLQLNAETVAGANTEATAKTNEVTRATKLYDATKYSNSGKNGPYDTIGWLPSDIVVLPKNLQGKSFGYSYDNGFLGTKQLIAGSQDEANAILNEQTKASSLFKNYENPDYPTGGTPQSTIGGIPTPNSGQGFSRGINAEYILTLKSPTPYNLPPINPNLPSGKKAGLGEGLSIQDILTIGKSVNKTPYNLPQNTPQSKLPAIFDIVNGPSPRLNIKTESPPFSIMDTILPPAYGQEATGITPNGGKGFSVGVNPPSGYSSGLISSLGGWKPQSKAPTKVSSQTKTSTNPNPNESLGLSDNLTISKNGKVVVDTSQQSFADFINAGVKEGDTINLFSGKTNIGKVSGPSALNDAMKIIDAQPPNTSVDARYQYSTTPQGKTDLNNLNSKGGIITYFFNQDKTKPNDQGYSILTGKTAPQQLDTLFDKTDNFGFTASQTLYPDTEKAILTSIKQNPAYFENMFASNPNYLQNLMNTGKLKVSDINNETPEYSMSSMIGKFKSNVATQYSSSKESPISQIFTDYNRQQNIPNEKKLEDQAQSIYTTSFPNNAYIEANKANIPKGETVKHLEDYTNPTVGYNILDSSGKIVGTTTGGRANYDYLKSLGFGTKDKTVGPYNNNQLQVSEIKQPILPAWYTSSPLFDLNTKVSSDGSLWGNLRSNYYGWQGIISGFRSIGLTSVGAAENLGEAYSKIIQPSAPVYFPQKGDIPEGLGNSTSINAPRISNVTEGLLGGGKTKVDFHKTENGVKEISEYDKNASDFSKTFEDSVAPYHLGLEKYTDTIMRDLPSLLAQKPVNGTYSNKGQEGILQLQVSQRLDLPPISKTDQYINSMASLSNQKQTFNIPDRVSNSYEFTFGEKAAPYVLLGASLGEGAFGEAAGLAASIRSQLAKTVVEKTIEGNPFSVVKYGELGPDGANLQAPFPSLNVYGNKGTSNIFRRGAGENLANTIPKGVQTSHLNPVSEALPSSLSPKSKVEQSTINANTKTQNKLLQTSTSPSTSTKPLSPREKAIAKQQEVAFTLSSNEVPKTDLWDRDIANIRNLYFEASQAEKENNVSGFPVGILSSRAELLNANPQSQVAPSELLLSSSNSVKSDETLYLGQAPLTEITSDNPQAKESEVFFSPSGNSIPSPLETGEFNYRDFITKRYEKKQIAEGKPIFEIQRKGKASNPNPASEVFFSPSGKSLPSPFETGESNYRIFKNKVWEKEQLAAGKTIPEFKGRGKLPKANPESEVYFNISGKNELPNVSATGFEKDIALTRYNKWAEANPVEAAQLNAKYNKNPKSFENATSISSIVRNTKIKPSKATIPDWLRAIPQENYRLTNTYGKSSPNQDIVERNARLFLKDITPNPVKSNADVLSELRKSKPRSDYNVIESNFRSFTSTAKPRSTFSPSRVAYSEHLDLIPKENPDYQPWLYTNWEKEQLAAGKTIPEFKGRGKLPKANPESGGLLDISNNKIPSPKEVGQKNYGDYLKNKKKTEEQIESNFRLFSKTANPRSTFSSSKAKDTNKPESEINPPNYKNFLKNKYGNKIDLIHGAVEPKTPFANYQVFEKETGIFTSLSGKSSKIPENQSLFPKNRKGKGLGVGFGGGGPSVKPYSPSTPSSSGEVKTSGGQVLILKPKTGVLTKDVINTPAPKPTTIIKKPKQEAPATSLNNIPTTTTKADHIMNKYLDELVSKRRRNNTHAINDYISDYVIEQTNATPTESIFSSKNKNKTISIFKPDQIQTVIGEFKQNQKKEYTTMFKNLQVSRTDSLFKNIQVQPQAFKSIQKQNQPQIFRQNAKESQEYKPISDVTNAQSHKQSSKQTTIPKYQFKQQSKPKQAQKVMPNYKYKPYQDTIQKKKIIPPIIPFGQTGYKAGKRVKAYGPTQTFQRSVNNPFAMSLSLKGSSSIGRSSSKRRNDATQTFTNNTPNIFAKSLSISGSKYRVFR